MKQFHTKLTIATPKTVSGKGDFLNKGNDLSGVYFNTTKIQK